MTFATATTAEKIAALEVANNEFADKSVQAWLDKVDNTIVRTWFDNRSTEDDRVSLVGYYSDIHEQILYCCYGSDALKIGRNSTIRCREFTRFDRPIAFVSLTDSELITLAVQFQHKGIKLSITPVYK
jgi:hypothetical protein